MATAYKVLGQSAPSATTPTTLYTVPSATETVVSTIIVCNRATTAGTYRISVRPNGASLANEHYIAYDVSLAANGVTAYTIGLTLDASDVLEVYASSANFSFSAYGSEITA
jgi:hypothetical protein